MFTYTRREIHTHIHTHIQIHIHTFTHIHIQAHRSLRGINTHTHLHHRVAQWCSGYHYCTTSFK